MANFYTAVTGLFIYFNYILKSVVRILQYLLCNKPKPIYAVIPNTSYIMQLFSGAFFFLLGALCTRASARLRVRVYVCLCVCCVFVFLRARVCTLCMLFAVPSLMK